VLIDSHFAGGLGVGSPKYATLSGTFTPSTTGVYTVDIYNYRNSVVKDLQNFIDDITLVPQTTDFSTDTLQFSASTGNTANLSIDPGPAYAGYYHAVVLSISGNWPGFTNNGYWVPFNWDPITDWSILNKNGPLLQHSMAPIDGSGHSWTKIYVPNGLGPTWVGRTVNVAYALFQPPGVTPIDYGSMPLSIYFIP
jgi:hypothetical protein